MIVWIFPFPGEATTFFTHIARFADLTRRGLTASTSIFNEHLAALAPDTRGDVIVTVPRFFPPPEKRTVADPLIGSPSTANFVFTKVTAFGRTFAFINSHSSSNSSRIASPITAGISHRGIVLILICSVSEAETSSLL